MSQLLTPTPEAWIEVALGQLDEFLIDHAACERKAAGTALSFLAHYPDKPELVDAMTELAFEELEHYRQVVEILRARGVGLKPDEKDAYVGGLRQAIRKGGRVYFLDRLLIFGVVEARGCERFAKLARALPAGDLKDFYREIARSEAGHQELFFDLARRYFETEEVEERQRELFEIEAALVEGLPIRPVVH